MSTDEVRRAGGQINPVSYEDRLAIATPEGVEVELTLANIGSRFIAGGIDFTIQLAVIISLALITQPAGDAGAALFTSAMFALIFFYDVLFEVLGGGRTPGKRWTGLRVVRSGGRPITLARSSVRNILRIIDIRHGDRPRVNEALDVDPGPAATWDVTAVSQDDVAAVRAFLERRLDLQAGHRVQIAAELASRLRPRVGGAPPNIDDENFLELLVATKTARS
jgi:hypothetical protein